MTEYIERGLAIFAANYAIDEHPFDQDPARPETFSDYNRGWNDACDFIQERIEERIERADVEPIVHAYWDDSGRYRFKGGPNDGETAVRCSNCGCSLTMDEYERFNWFGCPVCRAKMDGGV